MYTSNNSKPDPMIRKAFKNKLALLGAVFIGLLSIVAFLGFLISPDHSPHAHSPHPEIALQPPGFKVQFLRLECTETSKSNLLQRWWKGEEHPCEEIPVSELVFPSHYSVFASNGNILAVDLDIPEGTDEQEWYSRHVKERTFWLGTNRFGADVLSRIIIGARVSLTVGFMSVLVTLIIGTLLGLISGYYGGWVDRIVRWLINVVWSLPSLLIAIAISFAFQEKGLYQVFLAIGLSMWVELARIVRGQVLQIKEMEYIQAARVLGFGSLRILFRHVLPNIMAPIIVVCAANFASAILLEAGLSFLGLGVQTPTPSWGGMIKDHYTFIDSVAPHLAIIPGLCIMLLVMSFNFVGNGLRDALDVNLKD